MADIISSIEPGQYSSGQTLTLTFPPNTRRAIITRDDRSPVLTEILAYDTGYIEPVPSLAPTESNPNPGTGPMVQRPFIAVTQDGRGNVTFDGGFPKFYNIHIKNQNGGSFPPLPYTSWSQLPPAARYMNNCIRFCANPRKVLTGNKKILLLNTAKPTDTYNADLSLRESPSNALAEGCFKDTFQGIAQLGGWDLTILGVSAAGGKYDLDNTYFDQYAAVIFMGTFPYNAPPTEAQFRISEKCAQALALFRTNGNGVIIITDHTNKNFVDINDAVNNSAVFAPDSNRVAKYFGAYFTGDVNRQPVSVGTIRAQLGENGQPGDHILFEGLSDSDMIYAGGSESLTRPQLFDSDMVPHDQPWTTQFTTAGTYRVNVLVQLDDGTIITRPMRFVIINPGDITIQDTYARVVNNSSVTFKRTIDYSVSPGASVSQVLQGKIVVSGIHVGYFETRVTDNKINTIYHPFSGAGTPMPLFDGKTLNFVITEPFEYTVSTLINRADDKTYFESSGSPSTFVRAVSQHPYFVGIPENTFLSELASYADKSFGQTETLGDFILGMWWKVIGKGRLSFKNSPLLPCRMKVYPDQATWDANKPAVGSVGEAVIIANTNRLYYWDNIPMQWSQHDSTAAGLFDTGRRVVNTLDNSEWVIQIFTTVKV